MSCFWPLKWWQMQYSPKLSGPHRYQIAIDPFQNLKSQSAINQLCSTLKLLQITGRLLLTLIIFQIEPSAVSPHPLKKCLTLLNLTILRHLELNLVYITEGQSDKRWKPLSPLHIKNPQHPPIIAPVKKLQQKQPKPISRVFPQEAA